MSDTSQPSAPPPSAPIAPAPAPQTEVPVNETPVNQPTPLGDSAPPKPPGQESNKASHISRREALASAFERAKQAQEEAAKTQPKRAKPGMGHNQPPEAMEKAEVKKPPTIAQTVERYREGGRFAKAPESQPRSTENYREVPSGQPQPGQQPQPRQPLAENAPYREAPGRFSEHAKNEWHATPESVRGAVHQMAKEFQGAYDKYRPDIEVMEQLRPYHDLATKQGTSLRQAFDSYYGIEQKLRQDIIGGLDIIVQNTARGLGLKHPDGSLVTLQDVAHHIVNMTPEQHQLTAQRNQQSSSEIRIGQLNQQVEQLSQGMGQLLYQQRFTGTRQEVDKFAESHPRFDELADLIKAELDLGFTLDVAYQRADRLRPSTHAPQTRTQTAQTRKTSISGAPDGGNSVATSPSDGRPRGNGEAKHPTRRESIAKAIRRASNGI